MAEQDNPGLVDDELDRDYEAHVASVRQWLKSQPGSDEADDPAIDNAEALPFADWLVATAGIAPESRDRILAAMARADTIPATPVPAAPIDPAPVVQDDPTMQPALVGQQSKPLPSRPPQPTTAVVAPRPRLQIESRLEFPPDLTARHWKEGRGRRAQMIGGKTGLGDALAALEDLYKQAIEAAPAEHGQIEQLCRQADHVAGLAERAASTFRDKRMVPREAVDLCESIEKQARGLARRSLVLARKLEATEALNSGLSDRISGALVKLQAVKSDDDYSREGIQQEIRKITVALAQAESLRNEGFDVQADIDRCKEWNKRLGAYGEKARLSAIGGGSILSHRRQLQVMLVRLNREGLRDSALRPDAAGRDLPKWDPIDAQAEFPADLQDAQWKRSAGSTGLGKTGIGESLRDLEGAFNQVKWDSIRIRVETRFTPDQLVKQLSDARAALDQESLAIDKVKARALHVLAAASAWRDKNKGKPRVAKAVEHCERIISQATELIKSCDATFLKLAQITRYDLRICAKSSTIESIMRVPTRVDDCLSAVNEVEGWDDWQRLQVAAKIREITLALQGIPGAIDYGYDVPVRDPERCARLNEELKKYQLTDKRHSGDVGTHLAKLRAVLTGMRDDPVGVPEEPNGTGPGDAPATRRAFIRRVVRSEVDKHLAESKLTQDDRDYFNSLPENTFLHGTKVPGPAAVACVRGYFKFRDHERLQRETTAAA